MTDLRRTDVQPIPKAGKRKPARPRPLRRVAKRKVGQLIHYSKVRKDVESRAFGRCELHTPVCERRGSECHHLLPRSQGGPDDLGNCVWVCAPCHRYLHAHPAEAYEKGWLRRRSA